MDIEEIVSSLKDLDRAQLDRVRAALDRRIRTFEANAPIGEGESKAGRFLEWSSIGRTQTVRSGEEP